MNMADGKQRRTGEPICADDIVVLAKGLRAVQRLLESTQRYLEGKLKLRMNMEKSKVVSVISIRNFEFLGFALGKSRNGVYIRAHEKPLKKTTSKLKELTSHSQSRNVRKVIENVKVFIRGWLGYFGMASMKTTMRKWDEWLRCRYRCYIWKQWKKPGKRTESLMQLGIPEWQAKAVSNCRKDYWHMARNGHVQRAISKERLAQAGYYSILDRYESLHLCD